MKIRKTTAVLTGTLLLSLSLAACTQNAQGTTTQSATGESAATATTEASAAGTEATQTAEASDTGTTADTAQNQEIEFRTFMEPEYYLSSVSVDDYVVLGEYKDLEVTATESTISDEEIEYMLNMYESQLQTSEEVTGRPLQQGDIAQLDYSGRIKETGEVFDGGTAQGQSLEIGSGTFIDGFEDGMVGMEIGETRELDLKFPDPYYNNPDLAGVPVIFTVTLNGILERTGVSDETIASLGIEGVSTLEEFRAYMEKSWRDSAEEETQENVNAAASGVAVENATFSDQLPEEILDRYIYIISRSAQMQADSNGVSVETLVQASMQTDGFEGSVDEYIEYLATIQVKELLVYEAIVRTENLEPREEEIREGMQTVLEQTGFATLEEYEAEQGMDLYAAYRDNLMALAARKFLGEHAKVTYE